MSLKMYVDHGPFVDYDYIYIIFSGYIIYIYKIKTTEEYTHRRTFNQIMSYEKFHDK